MFFPHRIRIILEQIYLTGRSNPNIKRCQSGPGSNVNKSVLHTPNNSETEASVSDAVRYHAVDITFLLVTQLYGTQSTNTEPCNQVEYFERKCKSNLELNIYKNAITLITYSSIKTSVISVTG